MKKKRYYLIPILTVLMLLAKTVLGQTLPDIPMGTGVNPGIRGINTRPVYTLADENLNGRVHSYLETADDYVMGKGFTEDGAIYAYFVDHGPKSDGVGNIGYDIYPVGVPDLDKRNYKGHQIKSKGPLCYMLDHKWLNPVHMSDRRDALFQYDSIGNIIAIYDFDRNRCCTFEYDNYGRLLKKLENGKPTIRIIWEDGADPRHAAFSIKFYSSEGYNAGEYKYAWKESNVLSGIWKNGSEEKYWSPEFTFYNYPQVKTVSYWRTTTDKSTDCFFYDSKNRLIRVVSTSTNTTYATINGLSDRYYEGTCKTYEYNEHGDVCSEKKTSMYLTASRYTYDYFINYIFNYNYNNLKTPKKWTIWRYSYDDHKNWTKKEEYEVRQGDIEIENLKNTITREYQYYE
ncbi:MAG: hypothetical protein IJQ11_08185 [Bacteroidales bacterium]|nr:hypothetical protein [Bacteroidales bacterium]